MPSISAFLDAPSAGSFLDEKEPEDFSDLNPPSTRGGKPTATIAGRTLEPPPALTEAEVGGPRDINSVLGTDVPLVNPDVIQAAVDIGTAGMGQNEFTQGVREGTAGMISGMTTPKSLAIGSAFAIPGVAAPLGLALGTQAAAAGAGRVVGALESGNMRELGAGLVETGGGAAMMIPGIKSLRHPTIPDELLAESARDVRAGLTPEQIADAQLRATNLGAPGTRRPTEIEAIGAPEAEKPPMFELGIYPGAAPRFSTLEIGKPQILPKSGFLDEPTIIEETRPKEQLETRGKVSFGAEAPTLLRTAIDAGQEVGLKQSAEAVAEVERKNAEAIRSNQGQLPKEGQAPEGGEKVGGDDVQRPPSGAPNEAAPGTAEVPFEEKVKSTEQAWDYGAQNRTPEGIGRLAQREAELQQQIADVKASDLPPMEKLNQRAKIAPQLQLVREALSAARNEADRPAMTEYFAKKAQANESAPMKTLREFKGDRPATEEMMNLAKQIKPEEVPALEKLAKDAADEASKFIDDVDKKTNPTEAELKQMSELATRQSVLAEAVRATKGEEPATLAREKNAEVVKGSEAVQPPPPGPEQPAAEGSTAKPESFTPEAQKTPKGKTLGITPGGLPDVGFIDRVKSFMRKQFTSRGHLPAEANVARERMGGAIQAADKAIKYLTSDLKDAIAETYKIGTARRLAGDFSRVPDDAVRAMDAYLKGQLKNPEVLPENIRGALDNMRAEMTARSQAILDQLETSGGSADLIDTIRNNLDVYVTKSYRFFDDKSKAPDWYRKLSPAIRDRAEQFVADRGGLTKEQAQSQLLNWLSDLKGEGGAGGAKLGSKDLSQFMHRKQIAPEIRAVLGEHGDPVVNFARSVSKMADWSAKHDFLSKVREQGMGKYLFTDKDAPPGFNTRIAAEGSDAMSPLNGLRTTPEIADAFAQFNKRSNPGAIARTFLLINAGTKVAATVQSALTQVRNLTSQPFFWGMSGHWNLAELGPSLKAIAADLGRNDVAFREYIKDAARHGIVGDTARATELREILNDAALSDVLPENLSSFSMGTLIKKLGFKIPAEIYKISDELGKIYGWENEKALVRRVHPEWSDAQVKQEAANRVRDQYPTYSKIPAALKEMRKVPVVGPFVSFPYEVIRTSYHNLGRSLTEIRSENAAERQIGYKRLASQIGTLGATSALALISKAMVGISSDQEEDLRRFQPPWSKNSQYLYLGKDDNGKVKFINLSYQNPYSYLTDPAIAVASSIKNEEPFLQAVARSTGEFLRPFVSEQMLTAALVDVARNKTERGGQVWNPQDDISTKAVKIADHLATTLLPGTAQRARRRIIPALTGNQPEFGRQLEPTTEIAAELTGLRMEQFDFKNGLSYRARQFGKSLLDAEGIFRAEASKRGSHDQQALTDSFLRSQEATKRLWTEMRGDYLAALRSGVSTQEANQALLSAGLPKSLARSIAAGVYQPWRPGKETMQRVQESGRQLAPETINQVYAR